MIASRYVEIFIVLLGSITAIFLGSQIVTFDFQEISIFGFFIFLVVWAFSAGDYWWIPVLPGATILGVFKVGIKIYPQELGLALAIVALAPLIMVRHDRILQRHRPALPFIFYLTAVYITARFMVDIYPAPGGTRGNLLRIYFDAVWPFMFGFLFHLYGKTSVTRIAVGAVFILLSLRMVCSLIGYFFNVPMIIYGINYVLSFGSDDSVIAFRQVALSLLIVTAVIFHSTKSHMYKVLLLPILALAALLVIMGGSRFATLMVLFLPAGFFAWSRRWVLLGASVTFAVVLVSVVNLAPDSLNSLPPIAGRSLSGLVVNKEADAVHVATMGSDEWHRALMIEGIRRWSGIALSWGEDGRWSIEQPVDFNPMTFAFGYGVVPTPEFSEQKTFVEDPQGVVEIAANLGSYESGLWSVVSVMGLVGASLYCLVFFALWKKAFPYFLARPKGTFREGVVFWGCYSSLVWFLTCFWQGGYPSFELILMVLAVDLIEDGKPKKIELKAEPIPEYGLAPRLAR
jgi:hypothetical protein